MEIRNGTSYYDILVTELSLELVQGNKLDVIYELEWDFFSIQSNSNPPKVVLFEVVLKNELGVTVKALESQKKENPKNHFFSDDLTLSDLPEGVYTLWAYAQPLHMAPNYEAYAISDPIEIHQPSVTVEKYKGAVNTVISFYDDKNDVPFFAETKALGLIDIGEIYLEDGKLLPFQLELPDMYSGWVLSDTSSGTYYKVDEVGKINVFAQRIGGNYSPIELTHALPFKKFFQKKTNGNTWTVGKAFLQYMGGRPKALIGIGKFYLIFRFTGLGAAITLYSDVMTSFTYKQQALTSGGNGNCNEMIMTIIPNGAVTQIELGDVNTLYIRIAIWWKEAANWRFGEISILNDNNVEVAFDENVEENVSDSTLSPTASFQNGKVILSLKTSNVSEINYKYFINA